MKLTVKKTIGRQVYPFTFEGENLFECIIESQKLSFSDVPKCGCCGSDDLYLSAHIAKDKYKYHEIRCNKCKAELSFGTRTDNPDVSYLQRNDDGTLKWKKFTQAENENPNNTGNNNTNNNSNNNNKGGKQAPPKQQDNSGRQAKQQAQNKPSPVALNFVTKIAAADKIEKLEKVKTLMAGIAVFTDYDKTYINNEYARRKKMITGGNAGQMVN